MSEKEIFPNVSELVSIAEFKRNYKLTDLDDESLVALGNLIQILPQLNSNCYINSELEVLIIDKFDLNAERKNIVGKNE